VLKILILQHSTQYVVHRDIKNLEQEL